MGRRLTAAFAECYRQSSCELLFTAASRQFLLFGCQLPSLLDAGMNVDYLRSAARILVLINFLESWASASFDAASLSSWPPEACLCLVPWWQVPIPAHVRLCLNLFIHTFFSVFKYSKKSTNTNFCHFFHLSDLVVVYSTRFKTKLDYFHQEKPQLCECVSGGASGASGVFINKNSCLNLSAASAPLHGGWRPGI